MSEYKIFPPIAVARVGDAPDKFYIGPESYRGLPINPDGRPFTQTDFRDAEGRMCRQAARFKIYRRDGDGWQEVTLADEDVADIEWTVHVANKKSSWYEFQTNAGEYGYASNHPLRNAHVTGADRHQLVIDAGPRTVSGANAPPQGFNRDNIPSGYTGASFPPSPLYPGKATVDANGHVQIDPAGISIDTLGDIRTDDAGRLIFCGGLGKAGSSENPPSIQEYANNDHWWDDTSDGPIQAVVVLKNGTRIDAGSAWVMVGPPSYAPEIANLVTLWDTIFDTSVGSGHHPEIYAGGFWKSGADGYRPNFQTEIAPLLERATLYPWVAAIPPKPHVFDMERLGCVPNSRSEDENYGLRSWILDVLRAPTAENQIIGPTGRTMMPYLAGDNALIGDTLTSKYLRLTDTQYFFLQQWAEGWFVNEADSSDAPQALTRGVLENCVGGAFSPGIEMTWISRDARIYHTDDPLRINAEMPANGPLRLDFEPSRMQPGDVSRYMAVPWQADFNECSSQPLDGRILWWWPAQRPEYVYQDPTRAKTFQANAVEPVPDRFTGGQVPWIGTDFDQLASDYIQFGDDIQMVQYWSGLGFILRKEVPVGHGGETELRYVEVARTLPRHFYPDQ